MNNLYHDELEDLLGIIYNGDVTPLVYDLLKNTEDLPALLKYLNIEPKTKETIPENDGIVSLEQFLQHSKIVRYNK